MEKRFSYNPISKKFLESGNCHSTALYNIGQQKNFDQYIRGILVDNRLYLRLYYPLKDIDQKTIDQIEEKSFDLLFDQVKTIKELVKKEYNIIVSKVIYNAKNDLLRGVLTNI